MAMAKDTMIWVVDDDPELRKMVGTYLIDNAFSHGTAPVVVRLRRRGAEVAIEVWDQGQGMPANAWERALQPFQRLDSARGRQGHCG